MFNRYLPLLLIFTSLHCWSTPSLLDYRRMPVVSKVAISPNGERLAFRWHEGPDDLLVIYSLKHKKSTHYVDIKAVNPQYLYFLTDDKVIISVGGFKNVGRKHKAEVKKLFLYDLATKKLDELPVSRVYGFSNDKKYAFVPMYKKRSIDLNKMDLSSTKLEFRVEKGKNDTIDFFLGLDEDALVQETYANGAKAHRVFAKNNGRWNEIYHANTELLEINIVGLTPDYKNLVFTSYPDEKSSEQYFTMALSDGKITDASDLNLEDKGIEDVITNFQRIALGVEYKGFKPSYRMFDKKANELMEYAVQQFPNDSVFLTSHTPDWQKLVLLVTGPNSPGHYYVLDASKKLSYVESQYPYVKPEDIHPISAITLKARDGLHIPTLLTVPRSKVASLSNLPAVILPHGGPEAYDRIEFDWLTQAIANEGYMVVQPQFRGSSGFGRDHIEAGYGEWGRKMQDDITDVVNSLVEKGVIDKRRICIAGASYGGYAALAGAVFTPELYQCVVSINGVSDLPGFVSYKGYEYGRNSTTLRYWNKAMTEKANKEALEEVSPAYHADKAKAPVLLIHAKNDFNVRIEQSRKMAKALKKAGKKVELITIDDENHSLDSVESRSKTLTAIAQLLAQTIGTPVQ